jgi:hypothetical protein
MVSLSGRSMSAEMQQCLAATVECQRICAETVTYCLQQGGRLADESLIRLLQDANDFCRMTNDLLTRRSEWHGRASAMAAEVLAQAARRCAEFGDDAQLKTCSEACLRAASCAKRMEPGEAVSYDKVSADSFPASDPPATTGVRA